MSGAEGGDAQLIRQYDWTTTKPCRAVIKVLSEIEEVEPTALETPLYDTVDCDALDRLISTGNGVTVSFSMYGYYIYLNDDKLIVGDNHTV